MPICDTQHVHTGLQPLTLSRQIRPREGQLHHDISRTVETTSHVPEKMTKLWTLAIEWQCWT